MSFAARLFRSSAGEAVWCATGAGRWVAAPWAAGVRDDGAVAAGAAGESAGSVATPAVVGSSGHGGSLATAPGAPWGRDPGRCGRLSFTAWNLRGESRNHDNQPRWPAASA